jgi:hypothetical protein
MMQKYKDAIQILEKRTAIVRNTPLGVPNGRRYQKVSTVALLSSKIDDRISISLCRESKESEPSEERQVTQESLNTEKCQSSSGRAA